MTYGVLVGLGKALAHAGDDMGKREMEKIHAGHGKARTVFGLMAFVGVFLGSIVWISGTYAAEQDPAGPSSAGNKNPIPYARQSVSAGRSLYMQHCSSCHGTNGKAQIEAVSIATDLTTPQSFNYGHTDDIIFAVTQNGVGDGMPPFNGELGKTEIWNIVNFVKSLWKESPSPN